MFQLPGNISSQYVSGLLFALPLAEADSRIVLSSSLESAAYVDMTLATLQKFGVHVEPTADGYLIPGGQHYTSPGTVCVEGDWSNAAFFLAAGAIGKQITCKGLSLDSPQGDKAILDLLQTVRRRRTRP